MRKLLLISLLVSTTLLSFSNDSKAVKKEELKKFLTTKMNEFKKSDEFKEIKSSIADLKKELRKAKKNAPDKVEELNKKLENLRDRKSVV